jgi:hypothetical protein
VWAGFQDDEQFLAVSAEAELLYFRATARCKQLDQGTTGGQLGRHQLRRLCDKMTAAPDDLAAELVTVGLWDESPTGWRVVAYGEWNTSADEERQARADASRLANHTRWKHDGPVAGCTRCNKDVSPGHSGRTPNGDETDSERRSDRSPEPSLDVDETRCRRDETTPPYPPSEATPPGAAADLALVGLADGMIETLGLVGAVANEGERRLVARAIARGWTTTHLLDAAYGVAGRDDIDRPRAYLGSVLTRMANTSPPTDTPTPAAPERRGALYDERTPCATCDGSGMIGGIGDDGRPEPVTPCPACHVLGARA